MDEALTSATHVLRNGVAGTLPAEVVSPFLKQHLLFRGQWLLPSPG